MGVNGLWEHIKPAARNQALTQLAVEHACARESGIAYLRIGVDASIWIHAAQSIHIAGHAYRGQNPELNTIFSRLARLGRLPVAAIFVFDGPGRPPVKRGKRVFAREHWLIQTFEKFIKAFGFQSHCAPAEAEAELAEMSASGLVDAVLTDDSDTLVFGAKTIIRNPNVKKDKDRVIIYTREAIQEEVCSGLTRGGYILFAVLSGGDYDEAGLPGFGPHLAAGLARYGCGEALLEAAASTAADISPSFLQWRTQLRHYVRDDPEGYIGHRNPALASRIPDTFPSRAVLAAYVNPVTSFLMGTGVPPPCNASLPDVASLARLCEHYFTWGSGNEILRRFTDHIWPGVALRMLCMTAEPSVSHPASGSGVIAPDTILASRTSKSTMVPMFKLRFPSSALHDLTLNSFLCPPASVGSMVTQHVGLWIPAEVVSRCCPVIARDYAASGRKRTRAQATRKRKHGETSTVNVGGTHNQPGSREVHARTGYPIPNGARGTVSAPIYVSDSQSDDVSMFPTWVINYWCEENRKAKVRAAAISAANVVHSGQRVVVGAERIRRAPEPFPMHLSDNDTGSRDAHA
ncbi:PIN domain-like protein [Gloeophyllum trabeum ATCC 11539]|uniref:PIN domain-like protein n=1 Tax=Gloeophyllum trabeum (strain ATCC 11539 / FP-39264 / Madison 617) TaxID=670483 RepID=S7Q992_GLOTA|nr:PIN domain-like protein [Gloeophyllum trabeum ATCC 11539]EPQ56082.1 PIN domain-like protein [Gloeophyllum trabeum ATCC 11539]